MLNLNKLSFKHTNLESTRVTGDEADDKSLLAILQSHWLNPFSSKIPYVCQPTKSLRLNS